MIDFSTTPQMQIASWRFQRRKLSDIDCTIQNGVPTLQQVLDNVLAGRGTGLGNASFEDDDDEDMLFTDKLDLEQDRQYLIERSNSKPQVSTPPSDAASSSKDAASSATSASSANEQ